MREKGVMENEKTEAGVGENVSLPSSPLDPAEKGKGRNRKGEGRTRRMVGDREKGIEGRRK